jgi:hypothetical protein
MSNYTTQVAEPQSFVTKGKQRLKQYTDTVYLNNGDEFEIELYNPTTNKVLAKIELNGKSIGSGIVLRPGERVFLERYLDEAKKFLFETYEVDGKNNEVQQAIMKNGLVTVRFHNEQVSHTPIRINSWGSSITYTNPLTWTTNPTGNGISYTTSGVSGQFNGTLTTSNASYFSNTSATMDSLFTESSFTSSTLRSSSPKKSRSIETGRVEKGSSSDQSFVYDTTSFNTYTNYTNSWKILPKSQKVLVKEDLSVFCTECGFKRKKDSFKFCPQCGTKF